MELTKESVVELARVQAQIIINKLHRYAVTYRPPGSVQEGLQESMGEELTASFWYRERARHARQNGDDHTARLYEQIASEEDEHYREFNARADQVSR